MATMLISSLEFLSTPSARRATCPGRSPVHRSHISIHALREEGDVALADGHFHCEISIHALREEGDELYPGQPRQPDRFLSTPSARRATDHPGLFSRGVDISIHALREEGDGTAAGAAGGEKIFLSTPSARRATGLSG